MSENYINLKSRLLKYAISKEAHFCENVYHYTNINALYEILTKKTLIVTNSEFLNDREEILYSIDLIEDIYKSIPNGVINIQKLKEILVDSLKYKFILSFSLNKDSIALWGNYTNFEGYNIEIDLNNIIGSKGVLRKYLIKNDKRISKSDNAMLYGEAFGKVIYEASIQRKILKNLIIILNKALDVTTILDDNEREKLKEEVLTEIIYYINLFKHPGFKQEEEYRLVYTLNDESYQRYIKFTNRNGVIIPYIEIVFVDVNDSPKVPITAITIGPKTNMELAKKGLERLLESQHYNSKLKKLDIKILKSEIPYR